MATSRRHRLVRGLLPARDQGGQPRGRARQPRLHPARGEPPRPGRCDARALRAAARRLRPRRSPARRTLRLPSRGPGRRAASWGSSSSLHRNNVLATQRLLEACVAAAFPRWSTPRRRRSTATRTSCRCTRTGCRPVSPYGVTKLAGEHLCGSTARTTGWTRSRCGSSPCTGRASARTWRSTSSSGHAPGPRDRGVRRRQADRDFTYVDDIVEGLVLAQKAPPGSRHEPGRWQSHKPRRRDRGDRRGRGIGAAGRCSPWRQATCGHTWADVSRAAALTGYRPTTTVAVGLARQLEWQRPGEPAICLRARSTPRSLGLVGIGQLGVPVVRSAHPRLHHWARLQLFLVVGEPGCVLPATAPSARLPLSRRSFAQLAECDRPGRDERGDGPDRRAVDPPLVALRNGAAENESEMPCRNARALEEVALRSSAPSAPWWRDRRIRAVDGSKPDLGGGQRDTAVSPSPRKPAQMPRGVRRGGSRQAGSASPCGLRSSPRR